MEAYIKTYLAHMHKRFLYRATWLPQREMKVGQVGRFQDGKWTVEGTLNSFEIDFEVSQHAVEGNMEFTSEGGVNISKRLKGGSAQALANVANANADITIDFGKKNTIVFKANDLVHHQLKNKILLNDQILALFKAGRWKKDYLIVSEVYEAATATIIISSGANAKIELNVSGDVGLEALDLADAKLGLKVARNNNIGVQVIAESKLTPLYNVIGVRKSFFGSADLVSRGSEDIFETIPFGEED